MVGIKTQMVKDECCDYLTPADDCGIRFKAVRRHSEGFSGV